MARGRELGLDRITIKLIAPEHVKELAVVHLVESGAQRIGGRIAGTPATLPKSAIGAAGKRELLAEAPIRFNRAAKGAYPLRAAALRKGCCIEFKYKPPVHRLAVLHKRDRGKRICRRQQRDTPERYHGH